MTGIAAAAEALIHRHGPIRFDQLVELALYDPDHGFYGRGGGAGRSRDFLTSPEVGPLFGAVVAAALDIWWDEAGRPDPWIVAEAGAGPGTLARAVLAAGPVCSPALRYVLVERSAALRERHREHLDLQDPAQVLGPVRAEAGDDDERPTVPGTGPLITSLAELPALRFRGVILANELLDNLSFRLLERGPSGWLEVRVGLDGSGLVEVLVPADDTAAAQAGKLAPDAPVGGRIPLQHEAAAWVRTALERLDRGRLVLFDYASSSAEMARRPAEEWLRTYRGHQRGSTPLLDLGLQDVTCEVAVDQLAAVHAPTSDRSQADALQAWGIDDLVAEGQRIWAERAHLGDLEAVRARSRVSEAEALTDPDGLGAFRVLEWAAS
jgi:SAM-dependent MidA family methyltransferase